MPTIQDLSHSLTSYLDADQINLVRRAYYYAEQAHDGQRRKSGEPYVTHPLAVASILAEMNMDHQSLMAAMLHDVIEDTQVDTKGLSSQFGETVTGIVDGVSKLTHLHFETKAEAQAENFQKMVMAMAEDIRVILVKLGDRLHNMRTLGVMAPEKQRRIARETLDIYAPVAARLGMHDIHVELQDLAFRAYYPMRYKHIGRAVQQARGNRLDMIEKIGDTLSACLKREGLPGTVTGREKHLYSIYRKMVTQKKSFAEIMDVFAFRIVTDKIDTCYRILGAVHNLYKPVPGRFKDYIAIPKANGYQSLHTDLFGARDITIEIQIRTEEMEQVANQGIASHSGYKAGGEPASAKAQGNYNRARQWVQGLLEMQKQAGNSMEFIESVKIDLFPDEVYVFTPKGRILELPKGATPVDFAYAVHTDVGNNCVSCRINRRLAPLSTPLESGQTVEIITTPSAQPNMAWLNFVVTGKARTNIRHFLKHKQNAESVSLGRRLLNQFLANYDLSVDTLDPEHLGQYLKGSGLQSLDDLLKEIGLGNRMAYIVAQKLKPRSGNEQDENQSEEPLSVSGTEGMVLSYARCCHPIPGDSILGHISSGRGIVVHRDDCRNIAEFRHDPKKCVYLNWDKRVSDEFQASLKIELMAQRGIIATLATKVSAAGANIHRIDIDEKEAQMSTVHLDVSVRNRVHLAQVMKRIRTLSSVSRITRA
ncbi:bifunctional GTP diphosphokinase/guanosine-3',5'-bis pyrophosphate 3'-pyrophosphohydrolase [Motiliproteus sp. SC1-56]|uniref:bifunctional GTP diphosphokinase/guanosine-3',5'-bis pyrophosphate 3'-pyrophosphohydrolase n=1 Tax=Motiliproteus sp. SC1-56 TaxID=2799565 RepID=UPI001A8D9524|nr:bifunctional GTP diphosphokinase/guanosine-3',5'-bis pyrophosphate 3'-pyrophosphohydrolase [Motiliproteus sp. SC1-56]